MSAHDRNAARYRRDETLNTWSLRWVLDGNMLLCARCCVGQFARDADQPFQHGAGCVINTEFAKHPWVELRDLLADLAPLPA
ncbi:hypothetical protein [Pseudomonas fluorescens]|uniref:Uncharacterized protein n=1 Tax=Pseudomonas fluorescens TaxID=294 RepID=A0A4Y9TC11_PSEFL|nr:hypothetical protein [Pseudomonas fluorescens]TFW40900.1 hypothetical protein E4T65_23930 [Pseudomonas fluorescens]